MCVGLFFESFIHSVIVFWRPAVDRGDTHSLTMGMCEFITTSQQMCMFIYVRVTLFVCEAVVLLQFICFLLENLNRYWSNRYVAMNICMYEYEYLSACIFNAVLALLPTFEQTINICC